MAILTEQELTKHIDDIKKSIARLRQIYNRGFITDEETIARLSVIYEDNLFSLLRRNHCRIFLGDEQWLRKFNQSADKEDEDIIKQLMEALEIPSECFARIDNAIATPLKTIVHQYFNYSHVRVLFHCVDDNGLLDCDNPEGRRFVLLNNMNQKANITVKGHKDSEFTVTGHIEGYTDTSREKDMRLFVTRHLPFVFDYMEYNEDLLSQRTYPLWNDYFQTIDVHKRKIREGMLAVINSKNNRK